jgi:hypothetical protein
VFPDERVTAIAAMAADLNWERSFFLNMMPQFIDRQQRENSQAPSMLGRSIHFRPIDFRARSILS